MKGKIFKNCSNLFINKFKLFKSAFAQFKGHCSSKTKISFEAKKIVNIQFAYMKIV